MRVKDLILMCLAVALVGLFGSRSYGDNPFAANPFAVKPSEPARPPQPSKVTVTQCECGPECDCAFCVCDGTKSEVYEWYKQLYLYKNDKQVGAINEEGTYYALEDGKMRKAKCPVPLPPKKETRAQLQIQQGDCSSGGCSSGSCGSSGRRRGR